MLQKARNYLGQGLMAAGFLCASLPVAPAVAQDQARAVTGDTVQLAPGHPDSYVVRKGDTLWDISGRFLVKPWRWPELWKINPQIEDPHLIYPGDTVRLVYDAGKPQLTLERGSPGGDVDAAAPVDTAPAEGMTGEPQEAPSVAAAPRPTFGRDVKLEPRVREYRRDAISALPLEHIQQFLEFPLLAEVKDFELRPYVIDIGSRHSIRAGSLRDRVYVRGDLDPEISSYTVFSLQRQHEDPDKRGVTAVYEAQYVGEVRIIKRGDPAVAVVTKSQREMSKGDRLYPSREINRAQLSIIPHAPATQVEGRILSIAGGGNLQVTEYQVLLLDVGEDDGVDPGTVLSISTRGWQTEDRIYARQASLRGEKEGRISFEHEDQSPVDSILASFANDVHGLYRRFKELSLDEVSGVPVSGLPQEVDVPGSSVGTVIVFRSFPKFSYALVMALSAPTFIADRVHSPQ